MLINLKGGKCKKRIHLQKKMIQFQPEKTQFKTNLF